MCDELIHEGGKSADWMAGFVAGRRWERRHRDPVFAIYDGLWNLLFGPSDTLPHGVFLNPERDIIRSDTEIIEDWHGKATSSG